MDDGIAERIVAATEPEPLAWMLRHPRYPATHHVVYSEKSKAETYKRLNPTWDLIPLYPRLEGSPEELSVHK